MNTGSSITTCIILFNILNEVLGYLTQPQIKDLRTGHTIVGEDIMLECITYSNKPKVSVEWDAPLSLNVTMDRLKITTKIENITSTTFLARSSYLLHKATPEDKSLYYCKVADYDNIYYTKYNTIWVPVYDPEEHLIEFIDEYTTFDQSKMEFKISTRAHPKPTFHWIDHKNKTIDINSTPKFLFYTEYLNGFINYQVVVKFKTASIEDFGKYTLIVQNKFERKEKIFSFNITGPPSTSMSVNNSEETFAKLKCEAAAYPKPTILWYFQPCADLSCFSNKFRKRNSTVEKNAVDLEKHDLRVTSYISANRSDSGVYHAVGKNSLGNHTSVQYVFQMNEGFELYAENMIQTGEYPTLELLFNEDVEIICAASLQHYYNEITWYRNGSNLSLDDIRDFDEYVIKNINAVYSSISKLSFKPEKDFDDIYVCKATTKDGKVESKFINVLIQEQPTLKLASNMQNKTVDGIVGYSWRFYCNVDGYPAPTILWSKNNLSLNYSDRIHVENKNQSLIISALELSDNGTYKCVISNRLNQTISDVAILQTRESEFPWLWIIVSFLVIILVPATVFVIVKIYKERKLEKELKAAGLANFEEGAVEELKPYLRMDEQVELLPYDKKWEIPFDNLILGKKLGSGAFGVVFEGQLRSGETTTKVAVKTVNKFAEFEYIKALASEVKIMAHLGNHINVVNLVGACTKEMVKRKLLVVVEYCAFGSLHDYILQKRTKFIDQRNKDTDEFDWSSNLNTETTLNLSEVQYSTILFPESDNQHSKAPNDETQKEKYTNPETMSSKDLLEWSFQIANGMEYLSSRRVLHGDLAARNVLLTYMNVVKITDFGLSKNLYKSGIYKKQGKGPLPVKWMAVESIGENIFSTQSDVWSFGIFLWELFSLGKTPYPGVPVNQNFYKLLFNGTRMGKPEFSTQKLYEVMLSCWNAEPMRRPSFTNLASVIGASLGESVVNKYLQMNTPAGS